MAAVVAGRGPTEEQIRQAVTKATKELGNAHCVRKDGDVVCEKEPRQQQKVVSETINRSQRQFAAMHLSTPRTVRLSQTALMLEKVAKNLINSDEQFTLDQLGQVKFSAITGLCNEPEDTCKTHEIDGHEFRSADGCGNNKDHTQWGTPKECLKRLLDPQYEDGLSAPRTTGRDGSPLPNARLVSLIVHEDLRKPSREASHMLMQFGQFMSHEVTQTPDAKDVKCSCDSDDSECFNIPVPKVDPDFGKRSCLNFTRSAACVREGCSLGTAREQFHQVTAFVDASNVYGQSEDEMEKLRAKSEEEAGLAPEDGQRCFQAGDNRVDQNPGLTSLHTVFLREHNRVARKLSEVNPDWDDDRVFFEARKIIGAELQKIVYSEYLPLVLGPDAMTEYGLTLTAEGEFFSGYDSTLNPTISNVFATTAYRFGHSLTQNEYDRYQPGFQQTNCPIKLAYSYFDTSYVSDDAKGGPDSILRGLTAQPAQDFDRFMVSGLTKFLLADPPGSDQGFDLAAIDIQRGRDHGQPGYNDWREKCGLRRAPGFDYLGWEIPDLTTRQKLESLYSHVDDIDLFVGGLAEESVRGGVVGPTFACLIGLQFQDLRKGDRFWFENSGQFTEDQLAEIKKTSLARILCDNTDTEQMQPNVFKQPGNERVACTDLPNLTTVDLTKWKES
ncbi:PREDICTED: thyroid peroxidase-like [Branchiostoma belcheri]|uniref:Thyroid peroxidase-like n=1 Tax=Branchiostoma belcheri TaxID=7741 RepID=A0A6P4XZE9_BRABE|nr:PREDICTED: thyroid peroxidase-like [Branchiostoma belcheri]